MTNSQKIRRLYNLPENENFGFSETEIIDLETKLKVKLPKELRNYYLLLGKNENINYAHNRLLKPNKEIEFSEDRYLVFYEENQRVAYWGIKEEDLILDDPPVFGNYFPSGDDPDWHLETSTTGAFFLLMAIHNGTLGGLKYNANYSGKIEPETVKYIEKNWIKVTEISWEREKVYTNEFHEAISLSFDGQNTSEAIFIGASNRERFDKILDGLDIDWSYTSYQDGEEDFDTDLL
jgi:hypothetical protein